MELWDLYDNNRTLLGKTIQRGEPLPEGCYSVAVSIWTVNTKGQILLTLRAPEKESWVNYWENTGGAVRSGETSLQAILRELQEETGITLQSDQVQFLQTERWQHGFMDVYACCCDVPLHKITLQPGETAAAKWVTWQELEKMCANKEIAQPIIDRFYHVKDNLQQFAEQHKKK